MLEERVVLKESDVLEESDVLDESNDLEESDVRGKSDVFFCQLLTRSGELGFVELGRSEAAVSGRPLLF